MKINWNCFFNNSSTEEALVYFAYYNSSFKKFFQDCWPKECKSYIKTLSRLGYKNARSRAQKALAYRGYSKDEFEYCQC